MVGGLAGATSRAPLKIIVVEWHSDGGEAARAENHKGPVLSARGRGHQVSELEQKFGHGGVRELSMVVQCARDRRWCWGSDD